MPRTREFTFSVEHDKWIIDNTGGIPHNVDMWAYEPVFFELLYSFNKAFSARCRPCELIDHLIRGMEKKRYRKGKNEHKLPRFWPIFRKTPPKLTREERERLYDKYFELGIPRDRLAHTWQFKNKLCAVVPRLSEREVWHWILTMGKRGQDNGGLPRVEKDINFVPYSQRNGDVNAVSEQTAPTQSHYTIVVR